MSSEAQNEHFKFSDIIHNYELNDVVDKFRAYRLKMEANVTRLKEANAVIDQLKAEIDTSRDVETSLRSQITSAQNRLIYLQKTNGKILAVAERFRQSEKATIDLEQRVNQIEQEIQKIREESRSILKVSSNELDLMKKCEEVKSKLKNRENEINLLKIENQTLSKEKRDMEIQAGHEHRLLQNELEELRRKIKEMQAEYDQTLRLYKKQVEDDEFTIKEYERERKSLLEDFAMPKPLESNSDIPSADSTVLSVPDDRSPKNFKPVKSAISSECEEEEDEFFSNPACAQGNVISKRPKHASFKPKKSNKQKPQLEFLNSRKNSFDAPPVKRRLFSTNCNHYNN